MSKIGIMGGTFDPVHNAHLAMAKAAKIQADLDTVWFMPTRRPAYKEDHSVLETKHREEMVKLAIAPWDYFVYSDFELHREGFTYTSDTLQLLTKKYPQHSFYFIMGGDSFLWLDGWHEAETIMKLAHILAVTRDQISLRQIQEKKQMLQQKFQADIQILSMEPLAISSTQIRELCHQGKSICALVPDAVEEYIQKNHLYK